MIISRIRVVPTLLFILGVAFVYLVLTWLCWISVAHASTVADGVPAYAAIDSGWSLVETYGPVWGGMALAFGLARALLRRNESTHWIAQGRTLAVLIAVVGTGTAALSAHFAGTPWSGVLVTAVVARFKLLQPTVGRTAGTGTAGGAIGALSVLLIGLGVATLPACVSTPVQRTSTLSAALVTIEASSKAFEAFDATHQAQIVDTAKSLDDGKIRLTAYRDRRRKVETAIAAAYQAIYIASTLNDEPSLAGVSKAAAEVVSAVSALTGGGQ